MAILADENTRIIVQGITGREAATFTAESIAYGAHIVAGVTPGKGGTEVHGVPVYDTIATALANHPANASVISVPAAFLKDAALEDGDRAFDASKKRVCPLEVAGALPVVHAVKPHRLLERAHRGACASRRP